MLAEYRLDGEEEEEEEEVHRQDTVRHARRRFHVARIVRVVRSQI